MSRDERHHERADRERCQRIEEISQRRAEPGKRAGGESLARRRSEDQQRNRPDGARDDRAEHEGLPHASKPGAEHDPVGEQHQPARKEGAEAPHHFVTRQVDRGVDDATGDVGPAEPDQERA